MAAPLGAGKLAAKLAKFKQLGRFPEERLLGARAGETIQVEKLSADHYQIHVGSGDDVKNLDLVLPADGRPEETLSHIKAALQDIPENLVKNVKYNIFRFRSLGLGPADNQKSRYLRGQRNYSFEPGWAGGRQSD